MPAAEGDRPDEAGRRTPTSRTGASPRCLDAANIREPAITTATEPPRLYRTRDRRMVAGVASGIAEHLDIPVVRVRVAFAVLLGFNGLGLLLYAAFWAVVPTRPVVQVPPRRDLVQFLPYAAIGLAAVLVQGLLFKSLGGASAAGWLIALVGVGAGVIWHQSAPGRRRQLSESLSVPWLSAVVEENDRRAFVLRFIGGGVLVIVGIIGVAAALVPMHNFEAVTYGVIFALIGLAGVGLVVAPVFWRTYSQLRAEREARIREQERAELAAMVHDQVLHTLALILRNAGDAKIVQRLARGQERSLRSWLYKPTSSPAERLAAALEQAAAEVEDTYGISVEAVVVGDRETDERVAALVAAAREALVNAGRHAKVQVVSLYAEVEPDQISVFVRDRGAGFDPATVDDHRHGVRGSIVGRMRRHGGRAEIRSEPGAGTEVRLILPISAPSGRTGKDHD